MNDLIKTLLGQLRDSSASVRWALGACLGLAVLTSAFFTWQARNPHFVVLAADLDTQQFNKAVSALSQAGIRYETTLGAPPYLIRVEESEQFTARQAIHNKGGYLNSERGINGSLDGSSTVFLGSQERQQRTEKRRWEELELQLEGMDFIAKAKVLASGTTDSPLVPRKVSDRGVSVVLNVHGLYTPSAAQTQSMVGLIRNATNVDPSRITIVDQYSNSIYDGLTSDGHDTLRGLADKEGSIGTRRAQAHLDQLFGPGLATATVTAAFEHIQEESISEQLEPAKKPRSERSRVTETSDFRQKVGGPLGVSRNIQGSTNNQGAGPEALPSTSSVSEEEAAYAFGSKLTRRVAQQFQLARLTVNVAVDESIEDQLEVAVAQVKNIVGFDATRGDAMAQSVVRFPHLERATDGAVTMPVQEPTPEPTSPLVFKALEHGLEILVGIAFLFMLGKSLKGARSAGEAAEGIGAGGGESSPGRSSTQSEGANEEVDLDALARAHIEELLQSEPERVSALLSRWALSEERFAETSSN
jgi:flagellar biosynthesis/type III secretory pathway M-ring protein FliF/YscJ